MIKCRFAETISRLVFNLTSYLTLEPRANHTHSWVKTYKQSDFIKLASSYNNRFYTWKHFSFDFCVEKLFHRNKNWVFSNFCEISNILCYFCHTTTKFPRGFFRMCCEKAKRLTFLHDSFPCLDAWRKFDCE